MDDLKKKLMVAVLSAAVILGLLLSFVRGLDAPAAPRPKVGFLMDSRVNFSNIATSQYNGIRLAASQMGVDLLVKQGVPVQEREVSRELQDLIDAGCEVIILASERHGALGRKVIEANPQVTFYSQQADIETPNSYYFSSRCYEADYLAGMLAAMKSGAGRLGYVAGAAQKKDSMGINAFALGAQSIREDAVVEIYWMESSVRDDEECLAVEVLKARGADVVFHHLERSTVNETACDLEMYSIAFYDKPTFATPHVLANVRVQWGEIYQEILQRAFRNPRPRGVLLGVSDRVVDCDSFSSQVTSLEIERIRQARRGMLQGRKVFSGEIVDTAGKLRCRQGQSLPDGAVFKKMDWFVKGIVANL